ncbi:uncharacterized protein EV154DRAFT_496673 [Mucor mucedo]|uniref:uncharacterized protein n=1 Tax=Mucor mucedo TaxID=29922 RepID=UPI0022206950|nr:uncharacterized protein EV154DRAFT_496673 [Mucor mucedo]KAI7895000.1 hypothetical protein EV154DRAFT_496673 [Mucor mucedo]
MSKFPSEILNIVYSQLSKRDVFQCALTCKSWKESALSFFYRDLTIEIYGASLTKKLLQLDPIERDRYFQHGTSTKKLVVHSEKARYQFMGTFSSEDIDDEYTKEEWLMLLGYLPNIQVLNLHDIKTSSKYLQYILDSDDSEKILTKIMEIMPRGFIESHFAVCYKFHGTITKLHVEYRAQNFKMGSIKGRIITLLNDFTSLTHLTFNNECDRRLTTFDIMDACPHLVSLTYHSEYYTPDSIVKKTFDDDLSPKRLNSSVKELKLSVPTIPEHYANYIKQYLATHMDVVELNIHDVDVFDWVERIGLDNAVDFLRSLSKVKTASISWEPDWDYDRQTTSTESEPTIVYALVNAMKRKEVYCKARYDDSRSVYKSIKLDPDDSLYIIHGLKRSDYYFPMTDSESEEESDEEEHQDRIIQFVMPNRSISTIGPEIIHNMEVIMADRNPYLPLEFLRYALNSCPHLQQFSYMSRSRPNRRICIGTDLKMMLNAVRERKSLSNSTQKNIKVVKLKNMMPSNELLDLMRMYMPATEAFICSEDRFRERFEERFEDSPNEPFEADLTAFKQLNLVQLSARMLCGKIRQNTTFMEIHFVDKDWEYYCLEIDGTDLTITKTTLEQTKEQISKENECIRKCVVQCHKHVKFIVSLDYFRTIEISNGEISRLGQNPSNSIHNRFLE